MQYASASRLLARRPGNQNDFWRLLVLAHAPVQKNCMTLHDAEARPNFISFISGHMGESQKSLVFPRILPMKMGLWLGAESNRRHVEFSVHCSTNARLQCIIDSKRFVGELTSGDRRMHQTGSRRQL